MLAGWSAMKVLSPTRPQAERLSEVRPAAAQPDAPRN